MRAPVTAFALVATLLALVACAPAGDPAASGPRALTDEEAQLLAVVRLNNLREGSRSIEIDVPGEVGLTGWVDYEDHLGYGQMLTDQGAPAGLVSWDLATVAFRDEPTDGAPLPPPADGWTTTALDPSTSKFAATLAVVLNLADDRAENFLLLQQEGAQWLRTDTIDGVDVQVMRGPSSSSAELDYWVDAAGLLHRVDITFGGPEVTVVTFGDADGVVVPPLPAA